MIDGGAYSDKFNGRVATINDDGAEYIGSSNDEVDREDANTSPSERYRNTSQVNHSFSEQDGSNPLCYRAEGLNLANRESMLKKVEMPCCDGTGVSDWIGDIEYFYALGRYSDEAKMGLQGALKKWFGWVRRRGGFRSWTDFKQRLMLRFSESIYEEPETRLFALK